MTLGRARWAPARQSGQRGSQAVALVVELHSETQLIGTGGRGMFLTCLVTRLVSAPRTKV